MRGPDLLLAHLALVGSAERESGPSARERLDAELGAEFAGALVAALTGRDEEDGPVARPDPAPG